MCGVTVSVHCHCFSALAQQGAWICGVKSVLIEFISSSYYCQPWACFLFLLYYHNLMMGMGLSNSGSWWWTGRPDVLGFMGSQRVGHDWTELNWTEWFKTTQIYVLTVLELGGLKPSLVSTGLDHPGGSRGDPSLPLPGRRGWFGIFGSFLHRSSFCLFLPGLCRPASLL